MKNLLKNKIRVIKKRHRDPVTMRIGSRVTTITFPEDPKKKGTSTYHTDHALIPEVREIREIPEDPEEEIK